MASNKDQAQGVTLLPSILSRIPEQLPEELVFALLAPLITPSKESRDHHLLLKSPSTTSTAQIVHHLTTNLLGLKTTLVSVEESTSPFDLVKGFFADTEYKPKRRATTASRKPQSTDEHPQRGQRIFSTSITMAKRTLAQVIIIENLHLAKMEVQAILLEVMRERKLVTDFGAYSTPREFLVICILPTFNSPRLWDYLMDQFYSSYKHVPSITPLPRSLTPILQLDDFPQLQSQAAQVQPSTLIRSYISSILIGLRLHPHVISTSISSTAVGDIRNFIRVMALREGEKEYVNAEGVVSAVERCTDFRVRMEETGEKITYEQVLKEVMENVRAPL